MHAIQYRKSLQQEIERAVEIELKRMYKEVIRRVLREHTKLTDIEVEEVISKISLFKE